MKSTVNFNDFVDAFAKCGRRDEFSHAAKRMLFDYLEEIDPDYELDVIAICCEWSELSIADVADEYNIDIDGMDDEDALEAVSDFLRDSTQVAGYTLGGVVFQQF